MFIAHILIFMNFPTAQPQGLWGHATVLKPVQIRQVQQAHKVQICMLSCTNLRIFRNFPIYSAVSGLPSSASPTRREGANRLPAHQTRVPSEFPKCCTGFPCDDFWDHFPDQPEAARRHHLWLIPSQRRMRCCERTKSAWLRCWQSFLVAASMKVAFLIERKVLQVETSCGICMANCCRLGLKPYTRPEDGSPENKAWVASTTIWNEF